MVSLHEGKEEGMTLDGGKRLLLRPTFVVVCIAVLASNHFFLFVLLCWHPTSFFVCIAIDTILPTPGLETDHVLPFMQQLNARAVCVSVSHT